MSYVHVLCEVDAASKGSNHMCVYMFNYFFVVLSEGRADTVHHFDCQNVK